MPSASAAQRRQASIWPPPLGLPVVTVHRRRAARGQAVAQVRYISPTASGAPVSSDEGSTAARCRIRASADRRHAGGSIGSGCAGRWRATGRSSSVLCRAGQGFAPLPHERELPRRAVPAHPAGAAGRRRARPRAPRPPPSAAPAPAGGLPRRRLQSMCRADGGAYAFSALLAATARWAPGRAARPRPRHQPARALRADLDRRAVNPT